MIEGKQARTERQWATVKRGSEVIMRRPVAWNARAIIFLLVLMSTLLILYEAHDGKGHPHRDQWRRLYQVV